MHRLKPYSLLAFMLAFLLFATPFATTTSIAQEPDLSNSADAEIEKTSPAEPASDTSTDPEVSHRLIVQLESPPLARAPVAQTMSRDDNGKLDVQSRTARSYIAQLQQEQAEFAGKLQSALSGASVASYTNETGKSVEATYQIVFNGLAIDPGDNDREAAIRTLRQLPGVKAVYPDYAYEPTMYASLPLINAPTAWNNDAIGGMENAGKGIKIASMDGGVHHDAPMFDGTGYNYPPGFPEGGLGHKENNNGKIIASRTYFRDFDPPAEGDENPWPGENGTSHGVHTAGTAAGNPVTVDRPGVQEELSGVAPAAWVMSYRMFYPSVSGVETFRSAEGLAALEDIVRDGADVLNNSWGSIPRSVGGEDDPLDQALINVSKAGVFVTMSAGNSGPGKGTGDHPSADYINVAASTTSGTYAAGKFNIHAPEPVPEELTEMPFAGANFGETLPWGDIYTYDYLPAATVDPSNFEGCDSWPEGTFAGKAALISRGTCQFGLKVLNAEEAGAEFVVIYNHSSGGDSLVNMAGGDYGMFVGIPSIFIGHTDGLAVVDWYDEHGDDAQVSVDMVPFQEGNDPDYIVDFSSRGPGVGNVLKPDIAAPGYNILSQGYAPNTTGENRHMGYGQVSGTSMAAPHVTGAAALLRQIHPDWSNGYIKSALMSTSKYLEIYNYDDTPAQPLDMGAGRLDLTNAADPGVILSPPSLSFGVVPTGTAKSIEVAVTSVANEEETYELSTLYTGDGFEEENLTSLPGFSISDETITLAPGETETITVTFDSTEGRGIGDNQGYILLTGEEHEAHMPAWARVTPPASDKDVLLLDLDLSPLVELPDYSEYYTRTVEALDLSYDYYDAAQHIGTPHTIPDATALSAYDTVILFTGDNWLTDSDFPDTSVFLTAHDTSALVQYANQGGHIIAMGQDLAQVANATSVGTSNLFYKGVLGAQYLHEKLTVNGTAVGTPSQPVESSSFAPPALRGLRLDLSGLKNTTVELTGEEETPPISTSMGGEASLTYSTFEHELSYSIYISTTDPVTITAGHIHEGDRGANGPPVHDFELEPTYVTDTFSIDGSWMVPEAARETLLEEGFYVNIHTADNPGGEIRGQVEVIPAGDGAGNQVFMDEIAPNSYVPYQYPLLRYSSPNNMLVGLVAMGQRAQPTLERPGITYFGRSVYTSFGLEGVHNTGETTTREGLLATLLNWLQDEPNVELENNTLQNSSQLTKFKAGLGGATDQESKGATYRWDLGDGTFLSQATNEVGHRYEQCGTYTVRVEATNVWGNRAVDEKEVEITENCGPETHEFHIHLPAVHAGP